MPLITEECIRKVQDANDIVSVVENYGLKLKRSGSSFQAVCPFHKEKTPSFNVNPQMGIFKCFGCGVAGSAIKFVELMERCEFPEAVELLANNAGIELEYEGGGSPGVANSQKNDSRKALRWANHIAKDYFKKALMDQNVGASAREYLLSRGFTEETIAAWDLGWSPESWDGLLNYYLQVVTSAGGEHKRDKATKFGIEAGIFRYNEDKDRTYDAFRGRVMFPIFDMQQRTIGFGGRVLEEKPDSGGKYLNTSESAIFQKRTLLFGLNYAAKEIGLTKTAIVVEGYTDTIMCHQYGIRNVVATLGTSLTHEHVKLLRRYIHNEGRVIALFDNDNAGRKATDRAIEIFMEEGVTLHVLQGLDVKDAGEFLPKYGVEKFKEFLESGKESFSYTLDKELGQDFAGDLGRKAVAVERIMELVNRCPNAIRREIMRRKVAEVAGIAEETLPKWQEKSTGFAPHTGNNTEQPIKKRTFENSAPIIVDAKREGRLRAEKRLLRYMYEERDWCQRIADEYPPDEWLGADTHATACLIRDNWEESSSEKLQLDKLLLSTVNEEVKACLSDFLEHEGALLSNEELLAILSRLKVEEIKDQLGTVNSTIAKAEMDNNKDVLDGLLREKLELEKRLRQFGGL